jgi:N-methylhydantoinase B
LPGGGGYGDPFARDPQAVLADVVDGYVSLEAAQRDYGVVIHCTRRPDEQVSLPRHFSIDQEATAALRAR